METARGGRVAGGRARGRGRGGGRGRGRAAQVTTSPDADIQMTNSAAVDPSVVMGDSKQSKANASRNRKLDKEAERTTSSNNVKASKGRKGSKKPNTGKGVPKLFQLVNDATSKKQNIAARCANFNSISVEALLSPCDKVAMTVSHELIDRICACAVDPDTPESVCSAAGRCVGTLTRGRLDFTKSYIDWVTSVLRCEIPKTNHLAVIRSLMSVLEADELGILQPYITEILSIIRSMLEKLNSPLLLCPLLKPHIFVAKQFPDIFSKVFEDLVDLLVGWMIDPTLPTKVNDQLFSMMYSMSTYWQNAPDFTIALLENLLRDVEGAFEDITKKDCLPRRVCLLRTFCAITSAISPPFLNKTASIWIESSLSRFSICIQQMRIPWVIVHSGVNCSLKVIEVLISGLCKAPSEIVAETVIKFYLMLLEPGLPDSEIYAVITSIDSFVKICEDHLPDKLASELVCTASKLSSYRLHPVPYVMSSVMEIYRYLVKNASSEGYCAIDTMIEDVRELKRLICCNPKDTELSAHLTFTLLALLPVAATSTWPIRLKILELVIKDHSFVSSTNRNVAVMISSMQIIRNVLDQSTHKDQDKDRLDAFWKSMDYLLFLLEKLHETEEHDVIMHCLMTFNSLASRITKALGYESESTKSEHMDKCVDKFITEVCHQMSSCCPEIRFHAGKALLALVRESILNTSQLKFAIKVAFQRHSDTSDKVRKVSLMIIIAAPLPSPSVIDSKEMREKRRDVCKYSLGTFKGHHFQLIAKFLLDPNGEEFEIGHGETASNWLERLIYSCQVTNTYSEHVQNHSTNSSTFGSSCELSLLWVCEECARFCVQQRLRTPLGKASQTFEAFEKALQRYVTSSGLTTSSQFSSIQTGSSYRVRTAALVQFIFQLERHLFNAYEGCDGMNVPVSLNSRLFFRSNRRVCEDWFSRIRQLTLSVATQVGSPTAVCWHGYARLRVLMNDLRVLVRTDLDKQLCAFEKIMMSLTDALCDLRQPASILGLAIWARNNSPKEVLKTFQNYPWMPWIDGMHLRAQGQLEQAVIVYENVLFSYLNNPPRNNSIETTEFIIIQVLRCYADMRCWDGYKQLRDKLSKHANSELGSKAMILMNKQHAVDCAASLMSFDSGDFMGTSQSLRKIGLSGCRTSKFADLLCVGRLKTIEALANLQCQSQSDSTYALEAVTKASILINNASETAFVDSIPCVVTDVILHRQAVEMLNEVLTDQKSEEAEYAVMAPGEPFHASVHNVGSLLHLHQVLEQLGSLSAAHQTITRTIPSMQISLARLARKQQNLNLAARLLRDNEAVRLDTTAYEAAKLSYARGSIDNAVNELWDIAKNTGAPQSVCNSVSQYGLKPGPLRSRVLLRLAEWFQRCDVTVKLGSQTLRRLSQEHQDVLTSIDSTINQVNSTQTKNGLVDFNKLAGFCLNEARLRTPGYAKAHLAYGNWCYEKGRRTVGKSISGDDAVNAESSAEASQIMELIEIWGQEDPNIDLVDKLNNILKLFLESYRNDERTDQSNSDVSEQAQSVRRRLELILPHSTEMILKSLMHVWKTLNDNRIQSYQQAVEAYFTFLRVGDNNSSASDKGASADENLLAITLRLLRLLVRHGAELKDKMVLEFAETPAKSWQHIIPQLFARLTHPLKFVREQVLSLLCRIGMYSPHRIVYPAVVGKADSSGNGFRSIVESLTEHNPDLVVQVQEMISELKRITVLWEERWIEMLHQRQSDVSRRIQRLKDEATRVTENDTLHFSEKQKLISEKHAAIMKPVIVAVENLRSRTYGRGAESSYEREFCEVYGELIDAALNELKEPTSLPYSPDKSWELFVSVFEKLKEQAKRKIQLKDISPKLAHRKSSAISVPGLSTGYPSQFVTIQSFKRDVYILPTKTKPKKLAIVGSDGREYTFLFKGLEDLHLDERISQFLDVVNATFAKRPEGGQPYRARNYSVIPLGTRSGLIQWVDGAVPIFHFYKKWQHREHVKKGEKEINERLGDKEPLPSIKTLIPRPTEMFYAKLTPALKARGITNVGTSRSKWPHDTLRKVLGQLSAETPSDLLSRELCAQSTCPAEWYKMSTNYSRSMAVMSMMGYIFGLGDRHLDNILLDLVSGEVVHIDYNVCFEKGAKLRVPEVVPFRLTQNFRRALGISGVEGLFRTSCEQVLKMLRQSRETLLTLLDAFVYDPLVDWEPDTKSDAEKLAMEKNISHTLLASRVIELKVPWRLNHNTMHQLLPVLQDSLEQFIGIVRSRGAIEQQLSAWKVEYDQVIRARGDSDLLKALEDLVGIYTEERSMFAKRDSIIAAIIKAANEAQSWSDQHAAANNTVHNHTIDSLRNNAVSVDPESFQVCRNTFHESTSFLLNSGQAPLVRESEETHARLVQLTTHRQSAINDCLNYVITYKRIMADFPIALMQSNWCFRWNKWHRKLLSDPSMSCCDEVLEQLSQICPSSASIESCCAVEDMLYRTAQAAKTSETKLGEEQRSKTDVDATKDAMIQAWDVLHSFSRGKPEALQNSAMKALFGLTKNIGICEAELNVKSRTHGMRSIFAVFRDMRSYSRVITDHIMPLLSSSSEDSECNAEMIATTNLFKAVTDLFTALDDLTTKFRSKLVPEIIKLMHMNVGASTDFVHAIGMLADSGKEARAIFSRDMKVGHQLVSGLRKQYNELHESGSLVQRNIISLFQDAFSDITMLTPGVQEQAGLIKAPFSWACLMPELPGAHNADREMLSDKLFLGQLDLIHETLTRCHEYSSFFMHDYCTRDTSTPYLANAALDNLLLDHRGMVYGIGKFVAEFSQVQLCSALSSAAKCLLGAQFQFMGLDPQVLAAQSWNSDQQVKAEHLLAKAVALWTKDQRLRSDEQKQMDRCVQNVLKFEASVLGAIFMSTEHQNAIVVRDWTNLQCTKFQWLNNDVLSQHPRAQARTLVGPTLSNTVSGLIKSGDELTALQDQLRRCHEDMLQLETSIRQRLAWGKNSNRALETSLAMITEGIGARQNGFLADSQMCGLITNMCGALSHMETLRSTSSRETRQFMISNQHLIQAFRSTLSSLALLRSRGSRFETVLPLGLKELAPLGHVTHAWLESRAAELPMQIDAASSELARLEERMPARRSSLKNTTIVVLDAFADMEALVSELDPLLDPVVANGDTAAEQVQTGFFHFRKDFKLFLENIQSLYNMSDCSHDNQLTLSDVAQSWLRGEHTPPAYHETISNLFSKLMTLSSATFTFGDEPDEDNGSDSVNDMKKSKLRTAGIQEKNAHAVGIWKRVRAKLEGRDVDVAVKQSVSEQVDRTIREAISPDRLCQMYEGWTAWI